MINEIINREWTFFDKVQHVEGRASCQDNFEKFKMFRQCQFTTFDECVNESYLQDLKDYETIGLNPIMLKYAYMMETSDADGYQKIVDQLPMVGEQTKLIIDEIVKLEMTMLYDFQLKYPNLASRLRVLSSDQDEIGNVSFETYLRSELKTYGPKTLSNFGKMIVRMTKNHENIVMMTQFETVKYYGYKTLEEADEAMK